MQDIGQHLRKMQEKLVAAERKDDQMGGDESDQEFGGEKFLL